MNGLLKTFLFLICLSLALAEDTSFTEAFLKLADEILAEPVLVPDDAGSSLKDVGKVPDVTDPLDNGVNKVTNVNGNVPVTGSVNLINVTNVAPSTKGNSSGNGTKASAIPLGANGVGVKTPSGTSGSATSPSVVPKGAAATKLELRILSLMSGMKVGDVKNNLMLREGGFRFRLACQFF